jgi:hypothetical protein
MEFRLLDEDRVTLGGKSKDVIYDTVSYSLDRILATFRDVAGAQQQEKPEKLLSETVVFSNIRKEDLDQNLEIQLLRDRKGNSNIKCCKRVSMKCMAPFTALWKMCFPSVQELTDYDAKMQIEVEVWPGSLADRDPVGDQRNPPHEPPEPEGRYDMAYFARHPGMFCAKLMGPRNFRWCKFLFRFFICIIFFFIISYILFFLMESWFPFIGMLWNNTPDAPEIDLGDLVDLSEATTIAPTNG